MEREREPFIIMDKDTKNGALVFFMRKCVTLTQAGRKSVNLYVNQKILVTPHLDTKYYRNSFLL
jgi:hypothetical protein